LIKNNIKGFALIQVLFVILVFGLVFTSCVGRDERETTAEAMTKYVESVHRLTGVQVSCTDGIGRAGYLGCVATGYLSTDKDRVNLLTVEAMCSGGLFSFINTGCKPLLAGLVP